MKSFLYETAEDLVSRFGENLSALEIIFPNKRTDFHFKKYLGQILKKTSWSPKTYTIQQFAGNLTGIRTIDKISLLFELYDSFRQTDKEFSFEFDAFLKLGEIILNDFNEIDYYLVEADQIFTNIKNLHEIDYKYNSLNPEQLEIIRQYWKNFSLDEKSREKEKFLKLWNILPAVYHHFSQKLLLKNKAYEGLVYRQLALMIKLNQLNEPEGIKVFIGFNALNKAQKTLFKYLKNKNEAIFFWDNDSYYHHNKIQEAGDFLRVNYEVLNEDQNNIPGNFKAFNKKIKLIGITGKVGQAKAIPTILKELGNEYNCLENPEKTVIVLPDEDMLFPVLYSIPDYIPGLNITMGYPLKNTALYGLLIYFLKIQNVINEKVNSGIKIYHRDVLSVLNHPYIKPFYSHEVSEISSEIVEKQLIYVPNVMLLKSGLKLFETIFTPLGSNSASELTSRLLNLLFILFNSSRNNKNQIRAMDDEYIYHTYVEIKRLNEILNNENNKPEISFATVNQFIKQTLASLRIPFESKSTDGLQIMGLIETRNIDFDNVILLNANEGILPKLGRPPSLISESMRHAFDLPVLKFQDAIFAYFFYRLLQRSKNVYILYDNLGSSSNSGEISRFVYQLELESGFELRKLQLDQQLKLMTREPISIQKSDAIINKLLDFTDENTNQQRYLTATSIDTYLNCPFQFYLKYIAEIREPEKVEEEFTPLQMGNIIHKVMELFYKELMNVKGNRLVEKSDFTRFDNKMETFIEIAFKETLGLKEQDRFEFTGNLLIVKEVVLKYLDDILRFDEKRTDFEIVHLEEKDTFKMDLDVELNGEKRKINLKGIIDRIDRTGESLHIIDYKTGKAEKEFVDLDELFNRDTLKRKKAIFQVMLYGLLVRNNSDLALFNLVPGIYDIKQMYDHDFNSSIYLKMEKEHVELKDSLFNSMLGNFETKLSCLVTEIFDKEIPFNQTEFEDNCKYCSYRAICGKE